MRLALRVAPRAEREIRAAAGWWRENRRATPELFHQALAQTFDLITTEPGIGQRFRQAKTPDVRRIHLYHIRYHLYYRVRNEEVHVLAFWHSSRGAAPRL